MAVDAALFLSQYSSLVCMDLLSAVHLSDTHGESSYAPPAFALEAVTAKIFWSSATGQHCDCTSSFAPSLVTYTLHVTKNSKQLREQQC